MKKENLNIENAKKEIHNAFRKYKSSVRVYGRNSELVKNDKTYLEYLLDRFFILDLIPEQTFIAGYKYIENLDIRGEIHPATVNNACNFENLLIN